MARDKAVLTVAVKINAAEQAFLERHTKKGATGLSYAVRDGHRAPSKSYLLRRLLQLAMQDRALLARAVPWVLGPQKVPEGAVCSEGHALGGILARDGSAWCKRRESSVEPIVDKTRDLFAQEGEHDGG